MWFDKAIPATVIVAGCVMIVLIVSASSPVEMALRVPDPGATGGPSPDEPVDFPTETIRFEHEATPIPGSWPRFRGADFDNIKRSVDLPEGFPPGGPRQLWSIDLGEGYAAPAVVDGRVYLIDYDQQAREDVVRCLALADGKDLWQYRYPVHIKRNHGMSRTVPAVADGHVVTIGPKCHVVCLDARTGGFKWGIDLVSEFATKVPPWYAGQCPLIDNGRAIIAPGGSALMIAVELGTGRVVWQTPNDRGWAMSHSSIIPVQIDNKRYYLYCAQGGMTAVEPETGRIAWQSSDWWVRIATVPTPVPVGDGRIFLTGGYNAGSMMMKLQHRDGKLVHEVLYRLKPKVFGSEQQTPVLYEGHFYGVIPGGKLACLTLEGKQLWTSPATENFGLGPYVIADGKLLVLDDNGVLTLAEATPSGYRQLDRSRVLHGHDAWGPLVLVAGRLLVRDFRTMACLEVIP